MNTIKDVVNWVTIISVTTIYAMLMTIALMYGAVITIIQDD
jgi:hypothetical protein